MILINELRIGNLVMIGDNVITMDTRIFHAVIHSFQGYEPEPIPLTEEWLLKFGFDKHNYNPFWFKKDFICISLVGKIELITWDRQIFKIEKEIHQVHQLQNLYFALTGTELSPN